MFYVVCLGLALWDYLHKVPTQSGDVVTYMGVAWLLKINFDATKT